jgi:hypothetical protein
MIKFQNIIIIISILFLLSYIFRTTRKNKQKHTLSESSESESSINERFSTFGPIYSESDSESSINVNNYINERFETSSAANVFPTINGLYARYQAKDYDVVTNTWADSSPNKLNIPSGQITKTDLTIGTNNGQNNASGIFTTIRGTQNTKIKFTTADINEYTLIYVCRYTGSNRNRILNGNEGNWLSGFHAGRSGVAYHEGWVSNGGDAHGNNWLIGVDSGNLYRSNGVTRGNTGGTITTLPPLGINGGGEQSDFEIAELIIFNRVLTADEYNAIETSLSQNYGIKVKLSYNPYINTKFVTNDGISIGALYARYQAKDYSSATNMWMDSSPNKLDIPSGQITKTDLTIGTNNGQNNASGNFLTIRGTPKTKILFTTEDINEYTIIYICRYNGNSKGRILNGNVGNWLSGFWLGSSGIAFHEGWLTDQTDKHQSNWFIGIDSGNLYRSNGATRGTTGGARTTLPPFGINVDGSISEKSDFEIAELIIFNRVLTADEYIAVETSLSQNYGIKLNLSYINSKFITTQGISIGDLYARYQAKDYDVAKNMWMDSSPNKLDIPSGRITKTDLTIGTNNGQNKATGNFPTIRGTIKTKIYFTTNNIDVYTIIYICRYNGNSKGRILHGTTGNWLSGFWGGSSGIAFHEGWLTDQTDKHQSNWFIGIDSGNLYRSNGVTRGITGGGKKTLPPIAINGDNNSEKSDFEIADLIIFNKVLNPYEYIAIENYLSQYYGIEIVNDCSLTNRVPAPYAVNNYVPSPAPYAVNNYVPSPAPYAVNNYVPSPAPYAVEPYSSLQLHLDASKIDSINANIDNNIISWNDLSPYKRVATLKNTSAKNPIYKSQVLNNLPGILFSVDRIPNTASYTSNGLMIPIPSSTFNINQDNGGATIFIVSQTLNNKINRNNCSLFSRSINNFPAAFDMYNNTRLVGDGTPVNYTYFNSNFNVASRLEPCLSTHIINSTKWIEYINGVKTSSTSYDSKYYNDKASNFYLCCRDDNLNGFNGYIFEIYVFNKVLTSIEIESLNTSLMQKWLPLKPIEIKVNNYVPSPAPYAVNNYVPTPVNNYVPTPAPYAVNNYVPTPAPYAVNNYVPTPAPYAVNNYVPTPAPYAVNNYVPTTVNNYVPSPAPYAVNNYVPTPVNNYVPSPVPYEVNNYVPSPAPYPVNIYVPSPAPYSVNKYVPSPALYNDTSPSQLTPSMELSSRAQLVESQQLTPSMELSSRAQLVESQQLSSRAQLVESQQLTPSASFMQSQQLTPSASFMQSQQLTPSASSIKSQQLTSCNNVPIKFTYTNIGYSANIQLFPFNMGNIKDLNSAILVAQENGATSFQITPNNMLYIGFMFDTSKITSKKSSNSSIIYAVKLPPKKLTTSTSYDYQVFSYYKKVDPIFNKVFSSSTLVGNITPKQKNTINDKMTAENARKLANSFGASAFFVNAKGGVYVTYNFNPSLFKVTTEPTSNDVAYNQIFFAKCLFK